MKNATRGESSVGAFFVVLALGMAWLTFLVGGWAADTWRDQTRHDDFSRWTASNGRLLALQILPGPAGFSYAYRVRCDYVFAYSGKPHSGSNFSLIDQLFIGDEGAAKARVETALGIAGRAQWQRRGNDGHSAWALSDVGGDGLSAMAITVRHATDDPMLSALTAEQAMPRFAYWLLFGVQGLLALGAAVAMVFFALASLPEGDPLKDAQWLELLFREHPRAQLRAWARSLRHFRFVRGSGGGMDDHGDCLKLALRASSLEDIESILARIGATAHPPFSDQADRSNGPLGESVSVNVGNVILNGYRCHGRLELSLADQANSWQVTQNAVAAAQALEPLFDPIAERLIDPPQDDRHCLCPKYYPAFWAPEKPGRQGRK